MKEELYLIFTASVNSLCGAHSLVLYKRHWCWLQWLWGKQSYLRNNANHLGNRPPSPHIFFTHASRITNAHGGTLVRQQGQPRRCGSWLLTNSDEMVAPWRNWNCAKKTCPMPWRTTSRDFDPRWQQCIHSNELVDAAQIAKKKELKWLTLLKLREASYWVRMITVTALHTLQSSLLRANDSHTLIQTTWQLSVFHRWGAVKFYSMCPEKHLEFRGVIASWGIQIYPFLVFGALHHLQASNM